ncbi:MAG: 16S rRNA (uracil(1498)-N(3))-methyltransferase [Phycisphaerales bacterium]|nr:16S rRNA (uracil(1498)-N(3))-methyltransferase [Phycisphaerales bacterium]
MTAVWFHHQGPWMSGETVRLSREETKHALGSKRLESGDEVTLFDGLGRTAVASITDDRAPGGATSLKILATAQSRPLVPRIHIGSAIPKGDRAATLLESLASFAAESFTPLDCERSVVRFSENLRERYLRVMRESCKQARQPWMPLLQEASEPAKWVAVRLAEGACVLIADHGGGDWSKVLGAGEGDAAAGGRGGSSEAEASPRIAVAVGPEGGFTPAELAAMRAAGGKLLSLGAAVLRVEYAVASSLVTIRALL